LTSREPKLRAVILELLQVVSTRFCLKKCKISMYLLHAQSKTSSVESRNLHVLRDKLSELTVELSPKSKQEKKFLCVLE
jgi:hypothetical protein